MTVRKRDQVKTRVLTTRQLRAERSRVLKRVNLSEAELRDRDKNHQLTATQRIALGDLDDLKWLMA